MGNPFDSGGGNSKKVLNQKATARAQNVSNNNARQQFAQNYNALFGQGPTSGGFTDSLRGYYGGATLQDIGRKLAQTNAYQPRVKNVTKTVDTGGGGGFMSILDPLNITKPDKFLNPEMPNFNIF